MIPIRHLVEQGWITSVSGVLHLGAHYGEEADLYDHDLPWAAGPQVVWVEGDPAHIPHLRGHVEHRPGHSVIEALVDERPAEVVLHLASNEGASSSVLDFGTHSVQHPNITYVGERALTSTTVDDLADGWDHLNLVTLDLQGLELRALRGASRLLEHVDFVLSEVNRAPLYVGCPMIEEIDGHLAGFERVWTDWTTWGWGDALWVRR